VAGERKSTTAVVEVFRRFLFPTMPSNSLASVPGSIKARQLYPENFHGEEGAYVQLEHGRVRYWFKGPPDGKRVRQPRAP
jgi:hypothetical protein